MNEQFIEQLGFKLGANGLPYAIAQHPIWVHLTLGLFIIGIIFDIAATLFRIERPIFKLLGLSVVRDGFYDVGWYNVVAASIVTFFTVAAGFFEIMLAVPVEGLSAWGLSSATTMLVHGLGGVALLGTIVGMAIWRGFQRYRSRKNMPQQVQWSYLLVGIILLGVLYVHGTIGAHLADDFGVHNTAANLVRQGKNPNVVLQP